MLQEFLNKQPAHSGGLTIEVVEGFAVVRKSKMFTFVFDISTDSKKFMSFIKEVRKNVREDILVDGVARLTAEVVNPEIFDMNLRSRNNVVTLRVRSDNLYVIGFSNNAGNWFEFSHLNDRARMIEGSTLLSYNGSYTNNGIHSLNEDDAILGQPAVDDAINGLANFSGTTDDTTRARLRALIVNFIESTRFDCIANRADEQMSNPSGAAARRLQSRDISLIRSWGALSRALRNDVNNPEGENPFLRFRDMGIRNRMDAVAVLGMVLVGMTVCSRQRRSTTGSSRSTYDTTVGLTLVEVVRVQLKKIDDETTGQLYGTISITDGFGTVTMFNRDKNNYQSIEKNEDVELSRPARALLGADDFVIDVNLLDHDRFSPDDQVAYGQVAWNSRDTLSREYDQIQRRTVNGKYGSVEVSFAVVTDAVVASVDVVMLDGDGETAPQVYGDITASTQMAFCGGQMDYVLFRKKREQYVSVPQGTRMPLERRVISAPRCSILYVRADKLWDRDAMSPDDEIAYGTLAFPPRLTGNDNKEIKGKYGRVRVYVTWSLGHSIYI